MRVTIHPNVIMEAYGKTFTGLGPKERVKWLFIGYASVAMGVIWSEIVFISYHI